MLFRRISWPSFRGAAKPRTRNPAAIIEVSVGFLYLSAVTGIVAG